ncbi:MAG: hypothetical protein R2877_07785 [Bdellovibrionota bacterium]
MIITQPLLTPSYLPQAIKIPLSQLIEKHIRFLGHSCGNHDAIEWTVFFPSKDPLAYLMETLWMCSSSTVLVL